VEVLRASRACPPPQEKKIPRFFSKRKIKIYPKFLIFFLVLAPLLLLLLFFLICPPQVAKVGFGHRES
jgi:hypothetical protein